MEFQETKSIFLQIADTICDKILNHTFKSGERLPSVREMAAEVGVNPNTVMRTYTELQNDGIIKNKRGIGFFVEEMAFETILNLRKEEFFQHVLPEFINLTSMLRLKEEEISPIIESLKKLISDEKK